MRSVTADTAAKDFGALLHAVEQGETVLVTKDGAMIAKVTPEHGRVVDRIAEVFKTYPLDEEAADELERAVKEMREFVIDREREWPDD